MIPPSFAPLLAHLWQSTLFAVCAGLLTLALRTNHASVRYRLWLAASYKFLIPFSWLVSLTGLIPWHTSRTLTHSMPAVLSPVSDAFRDSFFLVSLSATHPASYHTPVFVFVLWTIWACGALIVAVAWARQWWRIRRIVRAASPLPLDLPIPVKSTSARIEPGVFGIFRPVLLLPKDISHRLTPAQLQGIFAHELCHVRRRDNLTAALHMFVEAIFWFYPLVWWLGQRLLAEREQSCDEAVLESGSERHAYAESVLKVCEVCVESPLTCISGVMGSDLKHRIARIMTASAARNLNFRKKLLLSAAGFAAVAVPIVLGESLQTTEAALGRFEVVSIKPANQSRPGPSISPGRFGFAMTAETMKVLKYAYDIISDDQVLGGPGWINSEKYEIVAKADDSLVGKLQTLPHEEGVKQLRLMVQALLEDRFKLKVHHQTKDLTHYELVVAKNGPKLHEANPADTFPRTMKFDGIEVGLRGPGIGQVRQRGKGYYMIGLTASMAHLVRGLVQEVDRAVVDKTGLTGNYDFTLKWTPDESGRPIPGNGENGQGPGNTLAPDLAAPSLYTAIQEQLGLKLIPQKGPVEVIVIDHIERPSEN